MSETSYLRSDLFSLLELQRLDSEIDSLRAAIQRLKADPDVAALKARAAEAEAARAAAKETVGALQRTVAWEENEADSIRAEVSGMEGKMYGGLVASPKELDQMQKRVEQLRADLGRHEEKGLQALVELEDAVPKEVRAAEALKEAGRLLGEAQSRQAAAVRELEAKMAAIIPRREAMSGRVPPPLLALYERIRERRNGVGAASLGRSGLCSACLVEVPKGLAKKIMDGRLDTCESCGRLLIRSDEAPETE